jgi:general secretion pathway protein D
MERICIGCRKSMLGLALTGTMLLLAGCTSYEAAPITMPLQITKAPDGEQNTNESTRLNQNSRRDRLTSSRGPAPPTPQNARKSILSMTAPKLGGEPISVNFDGIRLPAFINTVFGDLLQVSFDIANSVTQKTDIMVTMRTAESLPPDEFYQLIVETLQFYGVSVVYSNNVYRIVDSATTKDPIPRIIRTRAISTIPADMRPLFYFEPLDNITTATMSIWLGLALKDRIQAVAVPYANGLLLLGEKEDVAAALDIIDLLDQPYMAGYQSLKLSPAYWGAANLAAQLVELMTAEGYSIAVGGRGQTAIKLIPVEALNVIIAFGTGEGALQHVLQWATDLDQPGQTVADKGVFYLPIQNAKAEDIAKIMEGFLEGASESTSANSSGGNQGNNTGYNARRIRVDEARNALIFMGSAEEYAQFRSLISQMDRAPLEVMIEATIAEVTLNQGQDLGVIFEFDDGGVSVGDRTIVTDTDGIFLSLIRDRGSLISKVNALADNDRVQILSSPRLVTSSGKAASINVGTQVPVITTQQTDPSGIVGGTSSILQSIQYRSTGVTLNIEPTINSNRRVELIVSQDVSEAQANNLSGIQSPIILTRTISTTLSLSDGETVLLGGLIQENFSAGETGIPYLKDIPFLGNLFKTQSKALDRTELIILLTPYIIDSPEASRQVRDAFRERLGEWANPLNGVDNNMENPQ